ncbi:hypothetical protein [uncultured Maribacter sp.]|uniref:hypothetical protein n=1 Tax=uncultured Maribacter sp. TaxID=431308 RepID=UPI002616CB73|nr:hypothetical protein [uncultured Maribacter sp.]
MKLKLLLIVMCSVVLCACDKDFTGTITNKEKIELTSENYIYEGDLEKYYINNEIQLIDIKLKNATEEEATELLIVKDELKQRYAQISSFDEVMKRWPVPCDMPNGKCVPVRFEYFIFSSKFSLIKCTISNINGELLTTIDKLSPLPGEPDLQYLEINAKGFGNQINIQIEKTDELGDTLIYNQSLGF